MFEIQLPEGRYQAPGESVTLIEDLARLVSTVPGVTAVTFSDGAPPAGGGFSFDIHPEAEGRPRVEATGLELPHPTVAPDYFSTMGIPLLAGHAFARGDGNDVVIVNDVLARRSGATNHLSAVGSGSTRINAGSPSSESLATSSRWA